MTSFTRISRPRWRPRTEQRLAAVILLLGLLALGLGACSSGQPTAELLVMCGAANQPAMAEIAKLYERETGTAVRLVTGGSGTLLAQIELSRQGDVYLPGSPDYIERAARKKLIFPDSVRRVSYLVPAIIVVPGNPRRITSLDDLARPGVRIALGNPETVCIGQYALEIFQQNRLLPRIMNNVVVFGGSCAKTANMVAMGQVDAMIGWRVLQYWNPDRLRAVPIAGDRIPRLSYIPVCIPVYCRNREAAAKFIDFILSTRGRTVYRRWGYLTSESEARTFARRAVIGGRCRLPGRGGRSHES
ncbi:MAG: molybdate ABC transporter substrate-binding protein [Deltaproteobacteria bacterium]|nr:molybdate ABC transporter substrate-binding protein [Deltaproteobacteria bacterium]